MLMKNEVNSLKHIFHFTLSHSKLISVDKTYFDLDTL